MTDIDWDELRTAATEAMERAYVPYSRFKVGAAALVSAAHSGEWAQNGAHEARVFSPSRR